MNPHQSLRDVPSSGQRFEMSAVIDQLHLLQVQSLQHLLTGSVHHLQLLVAVHQDQSATVDPLQRNTEDTSEGRHQRQGPGEGASWALTLRLMMSQLRWSCLCLMTWMVPDSSFFTWNKTGTTFNS